jgi:hypothetical protein
MKAMHVLDGVHIEEVSDPALTRKLNDVGEVKIADIVEVKFGIYTFSLEVVEVSDKRVVWKHIKTLDQLNNSKAIH